MLIELAWAEWHFRHEEVARMFDSLRAVETIPALIHLGEWVPPYDDEVHALARKAIRALAKIEDEAADAALERLVRTHVDHLSELAARKLN